MIQFSDFNVLLIGCGEIGALLDISNNKIQTHLKALTHLGVKSIHVYDPSPSHIEKVNSIYNIRIVETIEFNIYDMVIIASPTSTHAELLINAMIADVPYIVCEKPVTNKLSDIAYISNVKKKSRSKVFVNFIRQYIPAYQHLQKWCQEQHLKNNELCAITVHYTRGILNNGSHAFDLIHFLFGKSDFTDFNIISSETEIKNDPTITCFFRMVPDVNVCFVGLGKSEFSIFEIILYFKSTVIKLLDSGNNLDYYEIQPQIPTMYKPALVKNNERSEDNLLSNYMLNLYNHIFSGGKDNLDSSLNINQKILQISENV